jgi:cytochrome c biogenesis protein CcdA
MMSILRIVIAIIFFGHGIGHIMGFIETWTSWQPFSEPSFNESPWIFSDGVFINSVVGKVFGIFWLVAMLGFFASAVSLIANQSCWSTAAIIASIFSLLAVIPWWNTFTPGIMSKKSAVVVDIIILVALLGPWKDVLLARLSSG